jgi:hypothetical protein
MDWRPVIAAKRVLSPGTSGLALPVQVVRARKGAKNMIKRQLLLEGILALAMTGCTTNAWAQPAAGAKAVQPAEKAAAQPTQTTPAKSVAPTTAGGTKKGDSAGHDHGAGGGMMMGQGMQDGGMKGGGMMGGECPMMADAATKMEVKRVAKGVVITLTSDDAAAVTKLQNMAERMQLKHQAHAH